MIGILVMTSAHMTSFVLNLLWTEQVGEEKVLGRLGLETGNSLDGMRAGGAEGLGFLFQAWNMGVDLFDMTWERPMVWGPR